MWPGMEEYRRLLECAPAVVFVADGSGRCSYVNSRWEELSGQSVEAALGHGWAEHIHPDDRSRILTRWTGPEPVVAHRDDFRVVREDGRCVWVEYAVRPLDDSWVGTLVEVTEQKRQQAELAQARHRLEAVIGSLPITLWAVDADGLVTVSEGRGLEALGLRPGEMVGRSVFEVYAGRTDVIEHHRRALAGERISYVTHTETATFASELTPIRRPDGEPAGAMGVGLDVTEHERLEAQLAQAQRLESVGRLAGGIAHDFNNLLSVIRNYAQFVIDEAGDQSVRSDAEEIRRAAERSANLVRQLLAFSRREAAQPEDFDVNVVVEDLERLLRRTLGDHIVVRARLDPKLRAVHADRGQIEQAIMNLAVNARDAMPTGGQLELATAGFANGEVAVIVRDDGEGMPPEVAERAFDPYFTTKPKHEHSGLGLATVYGVVSEAGGRVEIDSAPGRGTTVRLLLPAA